MTKRDLLFFGLITLVFTSCGLSYSEKNFIKIKEKTVDGVEYRFINRLTSKSFKSPFSKGFKLENKISFNGLEHDIHKIIGKSDFESKIDLKNPESFQIDSVSFAVNESKDKVDLFYYLSIDHQTQLVSMYLVKDQDQWILY
ncbi:hypothetical protein KZP23_07350 [Echinicola marina]|uniref:hypothetical protein n=1 Tax=Echinicola marina TaxID=2859768 RepID=UPI001CF6152A|nr:hypothetical protein [Echinicola marina]UCS94816.1 hypothetical protein KZP23_07350 [Echinicola marina]